MITFMIEGKPFGKQRPRVTAKNGYAHAYTPQKTTEYEELIRTAYMQQYNDYKFPKGTPLSISIIAIFKPPKSDSKRNRERKLNGLERPTVKPDWDNIAKVICDALNGLAWEDDSQVVCGMVAKAYGEKACVNVIIDEIKENSI